MGPCNPITAQAESWRRREVCVSRHFPLDINYATLGAGRGLTNCSCTGIENRY